MKIAIVHDQLQEFGGAERVLVALKKIFPDSDIYTSLYSPEKLGPHREIFESWKIKTSWAQHIPFFKNLYSPLRFLVPNIWESFDFSRYDLVISSSGWYMSKNIKTAKPTVHISYIHHPPRYLYGYETAVEWQKYWPVKIYAHLVNHHLRIWDYYASQRADYFIVNSEETKRRVKKFYRRDATVIYPPVDIPEKDTRYKIQDTNFYYITVSRLARAKHADVLIRAANKLRFNLLVVGTGRDEEYLKSIAGKTVEFLGNIDDQRLFDLYKNAKAFLFAAIDEEFGIAPCEAMGYGVPVIAYASGGLKETIKDGVNGFLFEKLTEESLIQKIKKLEALSKEEYPEMRKNARKEAEQYSEENFKKKILSFIDEKLKEKGSGRL
ncbi:glycosyltransferase [Candidatus Roizmanbacteria bacterium]|nr:glycosyltransferase [Candidatus Roizmanbacteria bacterium]